MRPRMGAIQQAVLDVLTTTMGALRAAEVQPMVEQVLDRLVSQQQPPLGRCTETVHADRACRGLYEMRRA
jgi:hypothetical protein